MAFAGTQIRADGVRYTTGTGPTVNPVPTEGDHLIYDETSGKYEPTAVSAGGVTDHGALTGLADDDHTIYQPVHVGTTAPSTPATGDLWVDTN